MLRLLRFSLTGLILLIAAPALAVPVFITEAHVRGGTGFLNNVVNHFDSGTTSASASASGSGSVSSALISGSAGAAAGFLEFGGRASSWLTNANSSGAIRASATSIMSDTITSPGIADGSQGFLQHVFSLDGTLQVTNTTDTFVTASASVAITHDFGALDGCQLDFDQRAAGSQVVSEPLIFTDLIPFVYGTPFKIWFRLLIGTGVVNGPSDDFTATSDFLNTMTVLRMDAFDANEDAVTNASISGEGGSEYPSSVPEPQALRLLAPAGLALRRARRQR